MTFGSVTAHANGERHGFFEGFAVLPPELRRKSPISFQEANEQILMLGRLITIARLFRQ